MFSPETGFRKEFKGSSGSYHTESSGRKLPAGNKAFRAVGLWDSVGLQISGYEKRYLDKMFPVLSRRLSFVSNRLSGFPCGIVHAVHEGAYELIRYVSLF